MNDLTVIIPVYNVEQYLDTCVKSVLNQTLFDISVILVDDGSTDNSGKKCDYWKENDNRVRVIHKNNGGLMSAWKCGMQNSSSEYVGFVDSDDWISADMYEKLMETAKSENADLVTCGLVKEYENGQTGEKVQHCIPSGVYENRKIIEEVYPYLIRGNNYQSRGISPNRVTKVYRRSILHNCLADCDDRVSIGEDLLATFSFVQKASKIVVLNDFFPYHYRMRSTSMIAKYSDSKYDKMNMLRECMLKANRKETYDFTRQINTDYLRLILMQLDDEMLLSGKSNRELKHSMKLLYRFPSFQEAIKNAEINSMPIKYRLYLTFLRCGLYNFVIILRKLKKSRSVQ